MSELPTLTLTNQVIAIAAGFLVLQWTRRASKRRGRKLPFLVGVLISWGTAITVNIGATLTAYWLHMS